MNKPEWGKKTSSKSRNELMQEAGRESLGLGPGGSNGGGEKWSSNGCILKIAFDRTCECNG